MSDLAGRARIRRNLYFRALCSGDISQVVELEQQATAFPWSEGNIRDCLQAGYECWWAGFRVGQSGGQQRASRDEREEIVAYAILSRVLDELSLLNICVHPRFQGWGLGRQLLGFLLAQAADQRVKTLFLEVRASNHHAIALYESCGFRQTGRRKGYYPGQGGREDALVYSRELGPSSSLP